MVLAAAFLSASFLRIWLIDKWLPIFVDEAAILVPSFSFRTANSLFSIVAWQHGGVYQLYSLVFYISEKPEVALAIARLFYSVLPGIATVLLSYFVFKQFYSKSIALLSTFLLAINAFHVLYSRIAVLYSLSLFLYLLIFFFFSKGLRTGKKLCLLLSLLLLLLAVQISLPTVEFCILFILTYSIAHFLQNRKEKRQLFDLEILKSRSTIVFLLLLTIVLLFFFLIGTIPFFLRTLRNIPAPETGFEKMFGFDSLGHSLYSINHIADYLFRMNTLPISLLSVGGLIYGFYKKDPLILSWSLALVPGFFYGYYSRRVLFSVPLTMLLASISVSILWHKTPTMALGIKKFFKAKTNFKPFFSTLIVALIITISLDSFFVSFSYVTDLPNSNAPSIEKEIYVSRYTSGYGVLETISYIKSISSSGLIITDTPQQLRYYLLNFKNDYEVVDITSIEISRDSLLEIFSNNEKPVFLVIRWWKWANDYFGNLTSEDPGYPLKLAKVIDIPEATIDDRVVIYTTGKHLVWKLEDASFSRPTQWESNASFIWDKSTLGWPELLLSYKVTRSDDDSLEIVIRGNSSWAWTNIGVMQDNVKYSEGNLTYCPIITVDAKLLGQVSSAYLRIQLDFFDGAEYRHMIYANTFLDIDLPRNVFKNSSNTVYFVRKVPLNAWTSINIDAKNDYDVYFADGNYSYGFSLLSISGSTCNGYLDFLVKKAEVNYDCEPWSRAR
jgi:hypothetical protein